MAARRKSPLTLPPEQEILNIEEAATLLGVSVKTFAKVLREEDVPGRKVGREWKFSRRALINWVGASHSSSFLDSGDDRGGASHSGSGRRTRGLRGARVTRPADGFSVDDL